MGLAGATQAHTTQLAQLQADNQLIRAQQGIQNLVNKADAEATNQQWGIAAQRFPLDAEARAASIRHAADRRESEILLVAERREHEVRFEYAQREALARLGAERAPWEKDRIILNRKQRTLGPPGRLRTFATDDQGNRSNPLEAQMQVNTKNISEMKGLLLNLVTLVTQMEGS